jgi:hypothetical protein
VETDPDLQGRQAHGCGFAAAHTCVWLGHAWSGWRQPQTPAAQLCCHCCALIAHAHCFCTISPWRWGSVLGCARASVRTVCPVPPCCCSSAVAGACTHVMGNCCRVWCVQCPQVSMDTPHHTCRRLPEAGVHGVSNLSGMSHMPVDCCECCASTPCLRLVSTGSGTIACLRTAAVAIRRADAVCGCHGQLVRARARVPALLAGCVQALACVDAAWTMLCWCLCALASVRFAGADGVSQVWACCARAVRCSQVHRSVVAHTWQPRHRRCCATCGRATHAHVRVAKPVVLAAVVSKLQQLAVFPSLQSRLLMRPHTAAAAPRQHTHTCLTGDAGSGLPGEAAPCCMQLGAV